MRGFKHFIEQSEEQADIRRTLDKLPPSHRSFLRGFSISFEGGNTLKGDDEHIGVIQTHPKPHITLAAPWNYGREYTLLHEVGHLVWAHLMDHQMREAWAQVVGRTKNKQNQSPEELFSMAYANAYAKNKIVIHTHPEWEEFIKEMV